MNKTELISEDKDESRNRQEKYAQENFTGVTQIGDELLDAAKEVQRMWKEAEKLKKDKDKYHDELKNIREYADSFGTLFTVLSIKLTTSFSHALNGKSTKTLKDIIRFMDKYGIGDSIFTNNMRQIVQSRSVNTDNILELAAIIAAQVDDIDFIKELESFAEKNKGRKNKYEGFTYSLSSYGDFNYNMKNMRSTDRIAFEALVCGSKRVYDYYAGEFGLAVDYIIKYIKNKDGFWKRERLTKKEVLNVIQLEPKFMDEIVEYMPENMPENVVDIFFF